MILDGTDDGLVRLDVASRELAVSVQTVKKYCRCGLLQCVRLPGGHWRVWRSSVDAILRQAASLPK